MPVTFPNGVQIMAGINIRPFAKGILEELDKYYEVIVFTASHSCYANPVIDYLDPERKFVKARLFRYSFYKTALNVIKWKRKLFTTGCRSIHKRPADYPKSET